MERLTREHLLALHDEITKNMTHEEELAYWAEQTAAARREQQAVLAERRKNVAPA